MNRETDRQIHRQTDRQTDRDCAVKRDQPRDKVEGEDWR